MEKVKHVENSTKNLTELNMLTLVSLLIPSHNFTKKMPMLMPDNTSRTKATDCRWRPAYHHTEVVSFKKVQSTMGVMVTPLDPRVMSLLRERRDIPRLNPAHRLPQHLRKAIARHDTLPVE